MESPALVLLGGSQQQVVAIKTAKACGYRTVLCDYLPDNPGQFFADKFYLVSTTDRMAVLDVARKERAKGIIAYSSDPAGPTAAFVAQELNLPSNPLSSVEILSEKHLFRAFLHSQGLPCPQDYCFSKDEFAECVWQHVKNFRFPLVVKPTDSSGSKGVTVIESEEDLRQGIKWASEFSRNGILICEEFIERTFPNVIGGDIFVKNGLIEFWGLMACLRDEQQNLVPVGKRAPLMLSPVQYANVKEVLQQLVSALHIDFGELNVEIILGKNDVPFVLELGARAGGNMIPVQLSDLSGIDLVRANVMCAMGDDPGNLSWDTEREIKKPSTTHVIHSLADGIFEDLVLSSFAQAHCYRQVLYVDQGDDVHVFNGADKALGLLFFEFDDSDQLDDFLSNTNEHVRIVLSGRNAQIHVQ